MGVPRFHLVALLGAGLAVALLVAACGAAPGGGTPTQSATGTAGSSASASGSSGVPAGMATATSLAAWQQSGTGTQSIDTTTGNPKPPSLLLPGDKQSYVWADLKQAVNTFTFDAKTQGLFDFFFGSTDAGQGYLFRIDTRGGTSYSGFAATNSWTSWDCPQSGPTDDPASTWMHIVLAISGTNVTATVTWPGNKEVDTFNGQMDGCSTTSLSGTTFTTYTPSGDAFGFTGDALGATSDTWIANFT